LPTGPTGQPTSQPTSKPSRQPTSQPTRQPTRQPTSKPTRQPTSQPTRQPTRQPTSRPSRQPTSQPTTHPTRQPTARPSRQPTAQPSRQPTSQPSSTPTLIPTSWPFVYQAPFITCGNGTPTAKPTTKPTIQKFSPTASPTPLPYGWASVVNWSYNIQYPYDQRGCNRWALQGSTFDLKVYNNDSAFSASSSTKPRTEIRITNSDMIFGLYTYISNFRITCNTYATNIFQLFDTSGFPFIQLRTYDRRLYIVYTLIYNVNICTYYHHLNVSYNGDTTRYYITIDDLMVFSSDDTSLYGDLMYFKQGVYISGPNPSAEHEIFVKDVDILHFYK